ncbi:MAG: DUF2723 domain-containing protein [Pseudoflavonifractor sp.]|nr:DUF2723 domain-containing protein [Pseudoflavonifractor sp.]
MKRYNIINNSLGWLMFVISAVTYLLTLEPTASFWDCPEFISQGYKLEVGHPPGNPIFMLAARFFVNFAPDASHVALAVNAMSALLSAGTILLLFWTITHLVRRLIVKDDATSISLAKMLVIFGSGTVGALAYTWSDTFWFSAVEGEVYAFSSFCTALVFWLILKWENRADMPHSDRYLILIAYVIGISIAVHLLNLLCIPAIVLVFYYKKYKNTTANGSLIALAVSFVIVGLILYGLVPGFIEVAGWMELLCVNTLGMSFNMGVLIYFILALAIFIWAISALYRQSSPLMIKVSFILAVIISGIPFIGDGWVIPAVIIAGMVVYFFLWGKKIPVRILSITVLSILVIFIGYSSYALLLIRSSANPPMNQNGPDNVFSLSSYLNREQYGERPLFYGRTINSSILYRVDASGLPKAIVNEGKPLYSKAVKTSPDDPDRYEMTGHKQDYEMTPELNMLFPRMYDGRHAAAYTSWTGMTGTPVEATIYVDENGNALQKDWKIKPTFAENMRFFLGYQLTHMYWRYFMWNFAGRQNDIQGNGEPNHGNWISGIPLIDTPRLGDQSLLPDDLGKGNKGHNVFYMLPLILGIIGLIWQAFSSKRGIEQFWVVFFLFFMTGIAIVLYLNQTPTQPRERDYAFAGSFYAFAIWIGMGVAGLWRLALMALKKDDSRTKLTAAVIACLLGIIVPLQMVSQTWDDHDRSGRYAARDFGMNYLSSLDEDAIIFTNGDNDTFPLWYAQEVEGYRTDVRVVNLSYLTTDWYANQMRHPSYDAPAIPMLATPQDYAYDKRQFNYFLHPDTTKVNALAALKQVYDPSATDNDWRLPEFRYPNMYIPVDKEAVLSAGRVTPAEMPAVAEYIDMNMLDDESTAREGGMSLGKLLSLDFIATNAANGWKRPIYFAMTVPDDYYLGLTPYLRNTGMAYEVSPIRQAGYDGYSVGVDTDRMYENVVNKFRWGGLDVTKSADDIYLDETVRRMVTTTRSTMLDLATALYNEGVSAELRADSTATEAEKARLTGFATDRYERTRTILDLIIEKLPAHASPYSVQIGHNIADLYLRLGEVTGNEADKKKAMTLLESEIRRYGQYVRYYQSLSPSQYAALQRTDQYINDTYLLALVQLYADGGGDAEKLLGELETSGVDFTPYLRRQAASEAPQKM